MLLLAAIGLNFVPAAPAVPAQLLADSLDTTPAGAAHLVRHALRPPAALQPVAQLERTAFAANQAHASLKSLAVVQAACRCCKFKSAFRAQM